MTNREMTMPADSLPDKTGHVSAGTALEDFGKSFLQAGVISPLWNGFGGLVSLGHLPQVSIVNAENAENSTVDSWAQKIGGAVGVAADLFVLSKAKTGLFGNTMEKETAQSLGQRSLMQATDGLKLGAVYGGIFTPSAPSDNFVWGRIKNAASDGLTFGALSGLAAGLGGIKPFSKVEPGTLAGAVKDMGVMGAVGLPVGALGAEVGSFLNNGRSAKWSDVKGQAAEYAVMGFAFAGMSHAVDAIKAEPANTPQAATRTGDQFMHAEGARLPLPSSSDLSVSLGQHEFTEPATWRFVPETATGVDASQLRFDFQEPPGMGNPIIEFKRYINSAGQPARQYLARVIKDSDITIVGEHHTVKVVNPHRNLGTEVISELPPGSILAVELPKSLRPIFEEFNNHPGSEFNFSSPIANELSLQPALALLKNIPDKAPDILDMWKAARDKGVGVVPIDAEHDPSPYTPAIRESREATLTNELLALYDERAEGKPIVAWLGNAHGARSTVNGLSLVAKRISESPDFAKGQSKLSTVFAQIAATDEGLWPRPLQAVAEFVSEPVAIPIMQKGRVAPLEEIIVSRQHGDEAHLRVSDYDHVILYPPVSAEAKSNYEQRMAALKVASTKAAAQEVANKKNATTNVPLAK